MTHSMNRRAVLGGGLAMSAAAARAQTGPGLVRVAIKSAKGVITLDLDVGRAPITARNFLRYVDQRRYDGCTFYRATRTPGFPDLGLIQGGLQGDPARVLSPIAFESTAKTGLAHKDGTISMAASRPGTAQADFFICMGDQPSFDADPANPDKTGFAAFGQVVDGMDAARTILASPTSEHARSALMRGQMLSPPIAILSMRRAPSA